MKLRVSEVLRDRFNQVLLGDIEQFQNRFIAMDDLICLLKNDIAKVERLIPSDPHFMHTSIDRIVQTSKTSRSNLEAAQIRLRRLTADFNDFLLEKS